jgi:PQQ-dependent dehydrogenase (s-GDH family)
MKFKATSLMQPFKSGLLLVLLVLSNNCFSQLLEVSGNNTVISNGDTTPSATDNTDYGSISQNSKVSKTFIVKNTGTADLTFATTIGNRVKLTGTNADQFKIVIGVGLASTPLTLKAGTYIIMEVSCIPTSVGLKTATITLGSNSLTGPTYSFQIQANGTSYTTPSFKRTVLSPNLNYPSMLYVGPDSHLWISERAGKKISRFSKDGTYQDVLLDLSSVVYQTVAQDGLLGMVLHPNLGKGTGEDFVYVAYTYNNGINGSTVTTGYSTPIDQAERDFNTANNPNRKLRIVRFNYSIVANDGTLNNPVTLIEGIIGGNDHNSGRLIFGPDNKLYYTIGDHGANQGSAANKCNPILSQEIPTLAMINANDYSNYRGKSLRLNLDGTIPADNPTINGVKSHIFTYGHRNASGLTFGKTGILYSIEHGPNFDDELNILEAGKNYGWPHVSGYKDDKNYKYLSLVQYAIDNALNCTSLSNSQNSLTEQFGALESSWTGTNTDPISTWGSTIDVPFDSSIGVYSWPTIAPSSVKIYDDFAFEIPGWNNSIFTTTLKNGRVYRQKLSADGRSIIGAAEELFETINRYRDIAFDPNGKSIYLITDTAGATSAVINNTNTQAVTDKGKIIIYTYEETPTPCSIPVADVAILPTLSDLCCIATVTPPTATNNCSSTGGIVGTTTTEFPITSSQTIVWTYTDSAGNTSTQTQNVTITNSSTTWNGTTWSNGTPTASLSAIITGNYTVNSDLSACSLNVKNNALVTVNSNFKVTLAGSLIVNPGSNFTLNDNAALYQTNASAFNIGDIVVKRNSSPLMRLDYTLWSTPVASQSLTNFSPLTTTSRFYSYNTTTNAYNVLIPSINDFTVGQGYLIRMPNTHSTSPTIWNGSFSGVPNNGSISLTMVNGGAGKRFNLVGNPYPSPISMTQFVADNSTRIMGTLYFWRKTNGLGTAYCTWAGGVFVTNGNAQTVNPAGIIQTGQGFIVEARNSSTSVQFNNGQRVANTAGQFFKTRELTSDRGTLFINANSAVGDFSQMAVGYVADATLGVDEYDGKYYNDGTFALNSLLENEEYVIQGRPAPLDASDVVPLVFTSAAAGKCTISLDRIDGSFPGDQEIILKDNELGLETNLKAEPYVFEMIPGKTNKRFSLQYQRTLSRKIPDFDENTMVVFKNNDAIHFNSNGAAIFSVKIFDVRGRLVVEKANINSNQTSIDCSKYGNQVLIAKITSQDNKVISKKIVN